MRLSIVIPVYRVEQTLERCLESILRQPPADCEVILVDDGSPDACPRLCDEWAERDPHIRVAHQANAGLSAARNTGIKMATGDYITFVDSDDFVGDNTFAVLMAKLSAHPEFDMLEYPVFWHYGGEEQRVMKFGVGEYHDGHDYWQRTQAWTHTFACNKIYARRLFDEARFPVGKYFEDAHTLPALLKAAKVIGTTEEGMYYYTVNPDGITATADGERLTDLLEAHVHNMKDMGIARQLSKYYCDVLNIQLDVYEQTRRRPILPDPDWKEGPRIGQLDITRGNRMKLRVLRRTSVKTLCKINRLLHKMRRSR